MSRTITGIPVTARLSKRDVAELERLSKVSGRNVGQVAAGVIREALSTKRLARRGTLGGIVAEIQEANRAGRAAGAKPISEQEAVDLVRQVRKEIAAEDLARQSKRRLSPAGKRA